MRLPAPPVARAYLLRGAVLWLCARGVFAVVTLFAGGPDAARVGLVDAPSAAAPAVVPLAVLLGLVDRRQWGQRALLGNLGIAAHTSAALSALAAGLGEAALALVLAVVAGARR
jgi:hypothetical protein